MKNKGILWLELEDQFLPPVVALYPKLAAHYHVTLDFGCQLDSYSHLLGQSVRVKFLYDCWDGQIQACQVQIMDEDIARLCQNAVPHVTVSMREGIKPVQSNAMFQGEHYSDPLGFEVGATVAFYSF